MRRRLREETGSQELSGGVPRPQPVVRAAGGPGLVSGSAMAGLPAAASEEPELLARRARAIAQDREALVADNRRLVRALAAVVTPVTRLDVRVDVRAARRRQLWEMVMRRRSASLGHGWCRALSETAVDALPAVHGCAITAGWEGGGTTVLAATDSWVEWLTSLEETVAEGPTAAACRDQVPVLAEDLAAVGGRWPAYASLVPPTGCTGVVALPISSGAATAGALTVFLRRHRRLPAAALSDLLLLVDLATTVLLHDLDGLAEPGTPGSADGSEVARAVGLVVGRTGLDVGEAVSLLRARAFASGRLLTAVARSVVAGSETLD